LKTGKLNIFVLESGASLLDLFAEASEHRFHHSRGFGKRGWGPIRAALRELDGAFWDLAVVNCRETCFFQAGAGWGRGLGRAFLTAWKNPEEIGHLLLFAKLVRKRIPIALINRSDQGRLPLGSDWFFRRSHLCFVRELNPLPEFALADLFTPSGGNLQANRRARRILAWADPGCPTGRDTAKLRPLSLGLPNAAQLPAPAPQKKYDVFFAGDLHEKGLRGRLVEECRRHAAGRNWRLCLRERMGQEEFWKTLSESRLCLSPPGMGWDCWRHYEAMALGAVPLMPYPTIFQHQPPVDGQHCFYFPPEPGGLAAALDRAMDRNTDLHRMAEAGRKLALEHHTFPKLREYIFRETLAIADRSGLA